MASSSQSRKRTISVEDADGAPRRKEALPSHVGVAAERLASFVAAVWAEPSQWHRFDQDGFPVRALPSQSAPREIGFEIRDAKGSKDTYTYVYQPRHGAVVVRRNPAVEHPSGLAKKELPGELQEFALSLVAAILERPDIAPPDTRSPAASVRDSTPASTGATFADTAWRIFEHWIGPQANRWGWFRRFFFTFAGSATFFLAWALYVYSVTGSSRTPDVAANFRLTLAIIGVPAAIWFAAITAWRKLGSGPVRLYLNGFLLPYFEWTLVAFMIGRPVPENLP